MDVLIITGGKDGPRASELTINPGRLAALTCFAGIAAIAAFLLIQQLREESKTEQAEILTDTTKEEITE